MKDLQLDIKALRNGLDAPPGEALSSAPRTSSAATRSRSRRGAVLAGLAAIVVAALGLAIWWAWARRPAQDIGISRDTGQRQLTRLTFGGGLQTDATFSPDGRFIAYASDRAGNFDIWVQPIAHGEPIQVTSSVADQTQPDWSPDGTRIVYRSEADGGGVHVVPAFGGAERRLTAGGFRPRFSPDGRLVMYLGSLEHETTNVIRPDVFLIPSAGGVPRRPFERFWHKVDALHGVAWHPDGTRLSFIGSYRKRLGFFTAAVSGGAPVPSSTPPVVALGFEPRSGEEETALRRVWVTEFRWSPSGRHVPFSGSSNGLQSLWRAEIDTSTLAWSAPERLTSSAGADVGLAPSADGRRVAFTSRSELTRVWIAPFDDARDRVTASWEAQSPADFTLQSFDLSRDGRKLAFTGVLPGDGRTQVWEVMLHTGERKLRASDRLARTFVRYSFAADALSYGVEGKPGTVRVLHADGVDERVVSHGEFMFAFDWSPDGTAIIGSAAERAEGPWYVVSWPLAGAPHAEKQANILLRDSQTSLWGARYSPDGEWILFNAHGATGKSVIGVAPSGGAIDRPWLRMTDGREWADKPRWSPDGGNIYYISSSAGGVFNLHRIRFDPRRGQAIGPPTPITSFQSPTRTISPEIGSCEVGVAPGRIALTIRDATGSIWMLDDVGR
jgi:Tol biopolymer transport system component